MRQQAAASLNQPNQIASTGQPVVWRSRAALDQQNREEVKNEDEEVGQASTEQPVVLSSRILGFRIQGLLHSKEEQAEQGRVRDLINQIESDPSQDDLQADLRPSGVYNPCSEKPTKMIHDLVNVQYCDSCETDSGVQCSYCLSYWAPGIVYLYLWNLPESYVRNAFTESKTI